MDSSGPRMEGKNLAWRGRKCGIIIGAEQNLLDFQVVRFLERSPHLEVEQDSADDGIGKSQSKDCVQKANILYDGQVG